MAYGICNTVICSEFAADKTKHRRREKTRLSGKALRHVLIFIGTLQATVRRSETGNAVEEKKRKQLVSATPSKRHRDQRVDR
jgi:hypothetical protein